MLVVMILVDYLTLVLIALLLLTFVSRNLSQWLGKQPPGIPIHSFSHCVGII